MAARSPSLSCPAARTRAGSTPAAVSDQVGRQAQPVEAGTAPTGEARAGKPHRLRVRGTHTGRLVTWRGPRRARYLVTARLSDGRRLRWLVTGRRLKIVPLGRATRARVTVRRLDALGRPGRAATARG
ncbi:MAG: hypothetical protein H0U25_03495 [Thermoleophilaceae bacterium]|nr:hypothetical protein [Thermoleophilaceae bacterium]